MSEGLADLGLTYDQPTACLGGACYGVPRNAVAYWRCAPAWVWMHQLAPATLPAGFSSP